MEYAKAKTIYASSMWSSGVISNHQVHAKAKVEQLASQVSHTMSRLRSNISIPKRVGNTRSPRYARLKITPRALKSKDNSSPQSVKDIHKKK